MKKSNSNTITVTVVPKVDQEQVNKISNQIMEAVEKAIAKAVKKAISEANKQPKEIA